MCTWRWSDADYRQPSSRAACTSRPGVWTLPGNQSAAWRTWWLCPLCEVPRDPVTWLTRSSQNDIMRCVSIVRGVFSKKEEGLLTLCQRPNTPPAQTWLLCLLFVCRLWKFSVNVSPITITVSDISLSSKCDNKSVRRPTRLTLIKPVRRSRLPQ